MSYEDSYIAHYGVPGMRWGIRKFKEIGGRLIGAKPPSLSNIKKSKNRTDSFTHNRTPKKISDKKKEKAKKIVIAAGAVALTSVAAYGLYRRNKTTKNLSQLAKKHIEEHFESKTKNLTGLDLYKAEADKTKRLIGANSRRGAKKELGITHRKAFKEFMTYNDVKHLKATDILAQRPSSKKALSQMKGAKRSILTGKMREYNKREMKRFKKKWLKRELSSSF